jgi:hypothetical protein
LALKTVEMIVDEMRRNGQTKYFDTEFGTEDKKNKAIDDEIKGSRLALYTNGQQPDGYIKPDEIEWLFPEEFAEGKYKFFDKDASSDKVESSNEVSQGALNDLWFIGGLSGLATRYDLLTGDFDTGVISERTDITSEAIFKVTKNHAKRMSDSVYPQIFHCYARYGIYVFRFLKGFRERYVIIDGRIPCFKDIRKPVFGM